MKGYRTVLAGALAVALVSGAGAPAWSAPPGDPGAAAAAAQRPAVRGPAAPGGWTVTPTAAGWRLWWRSPVAVPMGDASVDFFA
ncbi:MAG TPA: hypothetical protein VES42_27050, partial [Pilimelia sp.]|nr:hypothetical protein [Pilimelia sp.]